MTPSPDNDRYVIRNLSSAFSKAISGNMPETPQGMSPEDVKARNLASRLFDEEQEDQLNNTPYATNARRQQLTTQTNFTSDSFDTEEKAFGGALNIPHLSLESFSSNGTPETETHKRKDSAIQPSSSTDRLSNGKDVSKKKTCSLLSIFNNCTIS